MKTAKTIEIEVCENCGNVAHASAAYARKNAVTGVQPLC